MTKTELIGLLKEYLVLREECLRIMELDEELSEGLADPKNSDSKEYTQLCNDNWVALMRCQRKTAELSEDVLSKVPVLLAMIEEVAND